MCRFVAAGSILLVAASMLLAGCEGPEGGGAPTARSVPASEAQPFFVGRWAATDAMCGDAAWSFAPDGLSTPGEVTCTFNDVTKTPEGYDIAATCWAGGPPEPERIRLSYAESARAMLVEGGPFNPVGLVACDGQQP
jgi:hypothetical protein